MRTKFFLAVVIIFLRSNIYSQEAQDKSLNKSFWNIDFSCGVAGLSSNLETGAGDYYSIEASYISPKNLGLFAVYSAFSFAQDKIDAENSPLKIKEAASGLKFYISDNNFLSLGYGFYVVQNYHDMYSGLNNSYKQLFGLNLGAGAKIKISDSYGIIIKGKFVNTFSNSETFTFAGLSAGFQFNSFRKNKYGSSKEKFSSGIIAGSMNNSYYERSHNSSFENTSSGSYGVEMTYKISDKVSLVGNYLHLDSKLSDGWTSYSVLQNDFAGGVRFYSGSGVLRLFAESLVDLRLQRENKKAFYTTADIDILTNSLGIELGAGAELEIFDNISGLFKVNVTKFDEPGSTTGILGGIKFGI